MSLGDFSNNNSYDNNKKKYSPKVYSPYRMSNTESNVDVTQFSSHFWNNMLVLSIAPKIENQDNWDHDNAASVYLSHIKARLLYNEICEFQKNPDQYRNVGVNAGSGIISICNGKDYGVNCPVLVVSKINAETGIAESTYAYQFKQGYHYAVRNYDANSAEFDKVYYDDLELEQIKTLLVSYYEAMTGAIAYTVMDNIKYDMSRINTKLDSCAEKLGIEYKKGGKSGGRSSGSVFDRSEGRNSFSQGSIDDIDSMMN